MTTLNPECLSCTQELYHLRSSTFMCYECVFDKEISAREFIKKREKEDLDKWKVNANVVRKCLYVQHKDTEYQSLAGIKKNELALSESTKQREYIDFLVKLNNRDVQDYVQCIQDKYAEILEDVEQFLEERQKVELELLYKRVKREKEEIIDCQRDWKELKTFYESGGDEKLAIVKEHFECFNDKDKKARALSVVKCVKKKEEIFIDEKTIEGFSLYVNGVIRNTYGGKSLNYTGGVKNEKAHGRGIVWSACSTGCSLVLFYGDFIDNTPNGQGMMYGCAFDATKQYGRWIQGNIKYIGNFTNGFFNDDNAIGFYPAPEVKSGGEPQRMSYHYAIPRNIKHEDTLFTKTTNCPKLTLSGDGFMGTFAVENGIITKGKITHAIPLINNTLVSLSFWGLSYEGDLEDMCPVGYGILYKGQDPLFKGDFSQVLDLTTLNGITYSPQNEQTRATYFFGIKYELDAKDGKSIADAYYFGDIVNGKPKGNGGVYRYSVSGSGSSATYTYIGATDLVDVKFK